MEIKAPIRAHAWPLALALLLLAACGEGDSASPATTTTGITGQVPATTTPTAVPPNDLEYVSGGEDSTCAWGNGAIWCWGGNGGGQLGDGSTADRRNPGDYISGMDTQAATEGVWPMTVGGRHACTQGWANQPPPFIPFQFYCWGENVSGQLGDGTFIRATRPVAVHAASDGASIYGIVYSAGANHTCATSRSLQIYCWGANAGGQLGNGTTNDTNTPTPVSGALVAQQPGWTVTLTTQPLTVETRQGNAAQKLSAGTLHTCALDTDGMAWCWGSNASGQLGDGTTSTRLTPVAVSGGLHYTNIAAGDGHTCAVGTDHTVWCWGDNSEGQLGNGTTARSLIPTRVAGTEIYNLIDVGRAHSCAVLFDGTGARCWGSNQYGQLGDGTMIQHSTPTPVIGTNAFVVLSAGARHSCGSTMDKRVYCWGSNDRGQLGDNSMSAMSAAPVRVVTQP